MCVIWMCIDVECIYCLVMLVSMVGIFHLRNTKKKSRLYMHIYTYIYITNILNP